MNLFKLENKHILITGASSGIGKQCAISCSKQGAKVTLIARNKTRLDNTLSLLEGNNHYIISHDISKLDTIEDIVKESVDNLGKIDGFIHAAGIEKTLPLKMHKPNIFEEIFTINTFSGFEFVRVITQKKFLSNKMCSVIFISSIMGVVGNSGLTGYSATKGAIIAGAKSMAIELTKKNVRVNVISPGHIKNTAMSNLKEENLSDSSLKDIEESHPLGLGETIDVANASVFLLSDSSKWITGTNLIVDGGYSAK
jgi:NAD(P)-dependent dehydrogenase (short-subunit alcohol dehydrogenase family)